MKRAVLGQYGECNIHIIVISSCITPTYIIIVSSVAVRPTVSTPMSCRFESDQLGLHDPYLCWRFLQARCRYSIRINDAFADAYNGSWPFCKPASSGIIKQVYRTCKMTTTDVRNTICLQQQQSPRISTFLKVKIKTTEDDSTNAKTVRCSVSRLFSTRNFSRWRLPDRYTRAEIALLHAYCNLLQKYSIIINTSVTQQVTATYLQAT